jgi:hypothetical protein
MENEHSCQAGTDNWCPGTGEDQSRQPQQSESTTRHRHRTKHQYRRACPETVLVVLMSNGSYVLVGYPQGGPAAFITAEDAGSLRQVLTAAFKPGHQTDESAIGNGNSTSESDGASPRWMRTHEHQA